MFWKYLRRVWSNFWSRIIAVLSTVITFIALFVDVRVDAVNLPPLAWLALAIFLGTCIFFSGFLVWKDDFREYQRTDPEIRCKSSTVSLKEWLDVEPGTGFSITETIVGSFNASLQVYNPRQRLIHLQTTIAEINSNWTVLEIPKDLKVINPYRAGQYSDGVISIEQESVAPISISFDIRFTPRVDEEGTRYLECLRDLAITLEFEAPGRKPVPVTITPNPESVHEHVKKRISDLMDHESVKRNHWRKQGLELFARYQNGC